MVINSDRLPPPFRHPSGGNGGTCCADVGQNFGVLAWWNIRHMEHFSWVTAMLKTGSGSCVWYSSFTSYCVFFVCFFVLPWLRLGWRWGGGSGQNTTFTYNIFHIWAEQTVFILIRFWIGCCLLWGVRLQSSMEGQSVRMTANWVACPPFQVRQCLCWPKPLATIC